MSEPSPRSAWALPAGLCLLAVVVRGIYLWQATDNPTFWAPAIDAARYDELARRLAAGDAADATLFWQPSFYPLWLAAVFRLVGPSLLAVKLLQVGLAGLTCLLTFRLGCRVAGTRSAGAVAAGIYAVWGPAVFFDGEILATGWATLFTVALPLLALATEARPRWLRWLALGVVGGLAIWCRPVFVPVVMALVAWLGWRLWRGARSSISLQRRLAGLALLAAGLAAVLVPVAALAHRHTGAATVLPLSGGVNLWVGNAPKLCQSLQLRPGESWQRLVDAPTRRGLHAPAAQQRYFLRRVAERVRSAPAGALATLGRKSARLVASREVPRNVDVYVARRYSGLLSLLVWRVSAFGFPFGLLLPLAALGLVLRRREVPAPLWLTVLAAAATLVAVFPAARYRVPLVPLLAVLAALGIFGLADAARGRRWRPLIPGLAVALAVLGLGTLPGRFCEEQGPFAAELHLGAGAYHARRGRFVAAERETRRALRLAPGLPEARVNLGRLLHRRGAWSQALTQFESALALQPRSVPARVGRALALTTLGRPEPAIADLRAVLRRRPHRAKLQFLLGQVLFGARRYPEAQVAFRAAQRLRPGDARTLNALAWIASGREDPRLREPAEAVRLARQACALSGYREPSFLDTLAVAHQAHGHPDQARTWYRRALGLARAQGRPDLAADIHRRLRSLGPAAPPRPMPGRPPWQ